MDFAYKMPLELESYEAVGDRLKGIMHGEGLTVKNMAQRLKEENVFQSYNTARRFVVDMRNGYMNFWIKSNNGEINRRNLEKLSNFFSMLEINADDSIIGTIKNFNHDFSYPLRQTI